MAMPRMKIPMKMPSLLEEFRNFAFKGSLIDLSIAVVIGGAFNTVIKSFVDNIIMPGVSFLLPGQAEWQKWAIGPANHQVLIGKFLSDTVNFLLIAFAVFIVLVKFLSTLRKHVWQEQVAEAPKTKECPACTSAIPLKAVKCPQCTADLPATPAAA